FVDKVAERLFKLIPKAALRYRAEVMAKPNPKLAPITLMGPTLGPRHGKSQSRTARTLLLACHFLRKSVTESIFPTYHQLKESSQRESPMPPEGVRRSSRIPKEIDILLVGSDTEGKVFSEKTKTVLLSRHGAGIVSRYKLSAEQELILRRLDTNKEVEVRVVGQIGVESDVYTYGVAFLDAMQNFWRMNFPASSEAEKRMQVVSLECGSCQTRETVEQSDLESDVYLVNDGIGRYCKKCGSSTFWKRASE